MKKLWLFFLIVLCLSSCGKSTPKLKTDKYMDVNKVAQTGHGRTVWVSSAKITGSSEVQFKKTFGDTFLKTIVQDELYKSGFNVMERAELEDVIEEHIFSKTMTSTPLPSNMIPAKYTLSMKLVNIQSSTSGIFLPLIYMDTDDEIECSVELKLIDNITGIAKTRSGHAIVILNSKNVLLFFGDITSNSNGGVEFAIRSAIRDALTKF
ncbi:hypothetical protein [Candidatus Cetobacterium colombiensis]|uniref:DUF3313 domain-containing protein n=1 Tax=Candidatus Cetobacterium colombiensis TaxID=3073100 RepID=A0ABU4WFH2_9FUSO|nr:hypothetical protein [Candidatus Cetobacterium colombiensis]MDX8337296.1 hypothetical protein [Candidatus Cetobacterium colombiensis]